MCKTYMESEKDWDLLAMIFVWTIRTTAKIFNGQYSPYEVITGMKPRSPLEAVLAQPTVLQEIPTERYVKELCLYLREVHSQVEQYHTATREKQQSAKFRELGPGTSLSVGDYVLVRKEKDKGVSVRLQHPHFDDVFQIVEAHGDGTEAKAFTVSNLAGQRDNLGFIQPVAYDRLTPVEVLPLALPAEDRTSRIRVEVEGEWKNGTVVAQSVDGKVYIRFDDRTDELCFDLSQSTYHWITDEAIPGGSVAGSASG